MTSLADAPQDVASPNILSCISFLLGMTDGLHPLNRVVFGALKSRARRHFRLRIGEEPLFRSPTTKTLYRTWFLCGTKVSNTTAVAGWDISKDDPWKDDPESLQCISSWRICDHRGLIVRAQFQSGEGLGERRISSKVDSKGYREPKM
jgi:hypothetical protein